MDIFKRKIKVKNVFASLFICALGTLMILAVNKSNNNDKVNLQSLSYHKGQLLRFYTAYKKSSSTGATYNFVALQIEGLEDIMGVYRKEQNYSDLLNNLRVGDTVLIYFKQHSKNYDRFSTGVNFNSDIYQLDINQKNYLQIETVKETHSKGNTIVGMIAIFMFILAIYTLLKD